MSYLLFMARNIPLFIFVLVLAALNTGTIRRNEDPIRDTQTNPIGYQQKMEEEKDGKKGPLLYSVKYNPSDKFMVAPPVAAEGEQAPAERSEVEKSGTAATSWWEEVPASEKTATEQGTAEPSAPSPPEGEQAAPAADSKEDQWW